MIRSSLCLLIFCVVGGLGSAVRAGVVYQTGFEDPPFAVNSELLGQDGWSTAIPPFLNPSAATITDAKARSGSQSVRVRGSDLVSSGGVTSPYDAVGSYRRPVNYAVLPSDPVLRIEADMWLDTTKAATSTSFFSQTIAARSGDNETLGEFGLSSMGLAEAFGFNSASGATPLFTASIEFNKWYRLAIDVNFLNRTTSYFLDGTFLGSTPSPSLSNVLLRGAMVVYALPNNSDSRSDYSAFFDNFGISASPVPEPSTFLLWASSGLAVVVFRRVRRRLA